MEQDEKYMASQLFNFEENSYLERTSRPLYAILFLLPFIVFYELGTIFINTDVLNESQVRVAAFVWLENFMEYIGFTNKAAWIAPALAVVVILLAFQIASRKKWWFSVRDFLPMTFECIVLAIPLIVLSLFLNSSSSPAEAESTFGRLGDIGANICAAISQGALEQPNLLADIVTGIGAGIYEELIFRLVLICLLMMFFQDVLRINHGTSVLLSVIASAALFSAHHHIAFQNGQVMQSAPFELTVFIFRTLAGVYFAALFAIRGFGVTAGTHAFYDIIATLINALYFAK